LSAALLAVVVLATSCARDDLDTRAVRAAVVTIEAEGCSLVASRGVGVVVGDQGMIVTVAHTIAGATRITVVDDQGLDHRATVRWFDPEADMAILKIGDFPAPGLQLARARQGRRAVILTTRTGFGTIGVSATVEKFITVTIEDIYRDKIATRSAMELHAQIRKGDSGAGVVDDAGRVVGIVYANSRQRPGVAFALDDTEIRRAVESVGSGPVANGRCA